MIALESLRVSAELDAAKYVAGAQAKSAADKAMVESANAVGAAVQATDRRLVDSASAVERLARQVDRGYDSQVRFEKGAATLARALDGGRISAERHGELLDLLRQRYQPLEEAANRSVDAVSRSRRGMEDYSRQTGLTRQQLLTLQYTFNDIAASLASGASPLTILLQQGGQVTQAWGGIGATFRAGFAALTTGAGLATAGVGLLAAGFGLAAFKAADLAAEARAFGVALRGMGRDAELTAADLHKLVEAQRDLGVGKTDARASIASIVRAARVGGGDAARIAALAPDLAAGAGLTLAQSTQALAAAAGEGYGAVLKLDAQFNLFDATERRQIRTLAEHGEQARALDIAMGRLEERFGGAAINSMSAFAQATNELGRAWDGLFTTIANSGPIIATVNALAGGLAALETAAKWLRGAGDGSGAALDAETSRRAELEFSSRFSQYRTRPNGLRPGGGGADSLTVAGLPSASSLGFRPGGGGADSLTVAAASANSAVGQYVEGEVRKVDDLARALGTHVSLREKVVAAQKAEAEIAERNLAGLDAETVRRLRLAEVEVKQRGAAADLIQRSREEAEAQDRMAEAQDRGIAAVARATAENQALAEVLAGTIDRSAQGARAHGIAAQAFSTAAAALAERNRSLREGNADLERMAEAEGRGAQAVAEVARQNDVARQAREIRARAEAEGSDKSLQAAERQIAALDAETAKQLALNQALDQKRFLIRANQDLAIARQESGAAAISDPDLRRAADLAIERQRVINQLTLEFGDINRQAAQERLKLFDLTQAERDTARFYGDVREQARDLSKDVSGFLVEGFVNAGQGGRSAFDDLWQGALAGAKRFAARIAATFLEQRVIMPIAMQAVGSVPGLFGIPLPQAAGGGTDLFRLLTNGGINGGSNGGGGFGLSSLPNPFSAFDGLSSIFGGAAFGGVGATAVPASSLFAGAGLGGVAELTTVAAGLGPGTGLGLSAFAGPAAIAAVAIPVLMSLFGRKKPSVGPNSNAGLAVGPSGFEFSGVAGADNGGNRQQTIDLVTDWATGANKLARGIGGTFSGPRRDSFGGVTVWQKDNQFEIGDPSGAKGKRFALDDQDAAQAYFVKTALERAIEQGSLALSGDADTVRHIRTALANTVAKSVQDLQADIAFAKGFKNSIALMNATGDAAATQRIAMRMSATDEAAKLGDELRDFIEKAEKLFKAADVTTTSTVAGSTFLTGQAGLDAGVITRNTVTIPEGEGQFTTRTTYGVQGLTQAFDDLDAALRALQATTVTTSSTVAGADTGEVAAAKAAAKNRVYGEMGIRRNAAGGFDRIAETEGLTGAALTIAQANERFAALRETLIGLGESAADADHAVDAARDGFRQRSIANFTEGGQAALMAIRAPGSGAIMAAWNQREQNRRDAQALGIWGTDQSRWVDELYNLQLVNAANQNRVQTLQSEAEAAKTAATAGRAWANQFKQLADGLLTDKDLSPLSAGDRHAEAKRQFEAIYARAKGTGEDAELARGQVDGALRVYLEASKANFGATASYYADFNAGQDALRQLQAAGLSIEQQQLARLTDINASIQRLAPAANQNRNWGAFSQRNRILADLTGYQGDFGGGAFQTWLGRQSESWRSTYMPAIQSITGAIGFADGGMHAGGWRIVGERGPELEMTGPARYWSAAETSRIVNNNDNSSVAMLAELRALRAEIAQLRAERSRDHGAAQDIRRRTAQAVGDIQGPIKVGGRG